MRKDLNIVSDLKNKYVLHEEFKQKFCCRRENYFQTNEKMCRKKQIQQLNINDL